MRLGHVPIMFSLPGYFHSLIQDSLLIGSLCSASPHLSVSFFSLPLSIAHFWAPSLSTLCNYPAFLFRRCSYMEPPPKTAVSECSDDCHERTMPETQTDMLVSFHNVRIDFIATSSQSPGVRIIQW